MVNGHKKKRRQVKNGFISRSQLVLCHVTPGIDHSLCPLWHGVDEGPQVLLAHVLGPHLQDGFLQLGDRDDVLALETPLHVVPGIFN